MALTHEISTVSLNKLLSFLFWAFLYLSTADQNKDKGPEWCSRIITLVHGTVASLVGFRQCQVSLLSTCQLTKRVLPSQYALMLWSWGYFAFDLLWCVVYWSESTLILVHHCVALIAVTRYMQKPFTGCTFSCTVALLEITNPLLQTRWFLKKEGYGDTFLFYIVEAAYLVTFIALRGIIGTYLVILIVQSNLFDAEEKLLSLLFYAVSMVFIYDITGYILHRYRKEIRGFKQLHLNVYFQINGNNEVINNEIEEIRRDPSIVDNQSTVRQQITHRYFPT